MFYLIMQILFASAFTLIIKWAQVRDREDVITIGAINYIVAALSITPFFLMSDIPSLSPGALWTGGSMGGIYFVAYFFAIYCIKAVGASSSTVVSVLSILFPITMSAMLWNEYPNLLQSAGIGLALFALMLIGLRGEKKDNDETRSWITPVFLLTFFFLCGCSRLSQEAFKHVSEADQRPTFVIAAFTVAAIPSFCLLVYRRKPIKRMEFVFGVMMGLCNMLQTHFILLCLQHYPGYIVFPVISAGSIVLTTLVATGMLHERLSIKTCTGIGLAVVALFMLR